MHVLKDHNNEVDGKTFLSGERLSAAEEYVAMSYPEMVKRSKMQRQGEAAAVAYVERKEARARRRRRGGEKQESEARRERLRGDAFSVAAAATGQRHTCAAGECAFVKDSCYVETRRAHLHGLDVPHPFMCTVTSACMRVWECVCGCVDVDDNNHVADDIDEPSVLPVVSHLRRSARACDVAPRRRVALVRSSSRGRQCCALATCHSLLSSTYIFDHYHLLF